MRRPGWTPSIVPRDDATNAYMMLDDLGRTGRIWPEADAEKTDLETSTRTSATDSTRTRSASMSRLTSPSSCAGAPIYSNATFPSTCRISSTVTKAATAISSCVADPPSLVHGVPARTGLRSASRRSSREVDFHRQRTQPFFRTEDATGRKQMKERSVLRAVQPSLQHLLVADISCRRPRYKKWPE